MKKISLHGISLACALGVLSAFTVFPMEEVLADVKVVKTSKKEKAKWILADLGRKGYTEDVRKIEEFAAFKEQVRDTFDVHFAFDGWEAKAGVPVRFEEFYVKYGDAFPEGIRHISFRYQHPIEGQDRVALEYWIEKLQEKVPNLVWKEHSTGVQFYILEDGVSLDDFYRIDRKPAFGLEVAFLAGSYAFSPFVKNIAGMKGIGLDELIEAKQEELKEKRYPKIF